MGISYVNGRYLYKSIASISIEDRGFNFSDGVYEVMSFSKKNILNYQKHIKRLKRSLKEIKIPSPFYNLSTLEIIIKKLIEKNKTNFKGVGQPLRIALTGSKFGPGIYDIILSLDKNEILKRLKKIN